MNNKNNITYSTGYTWVANIRDNIEDSYQKLTKKELKVRANEDAQNGLPEGKDSIPSGSPTENEIAVAFTQKENDLIGYFQSSKTDMLIRIQAENTIEETSPIDKHTIVSNMDTIYDIITRDSNIDEIAKKYADAKYTLRNFIHRHERDTPARYPDIILKPIAILLFFFLAETIINGTVFKDLSGGFLGGILQAAFFALINILLAFVEATGWRFLIYKDIRSTTKTILYKVIGFILTSILLIIGLLWNLGVAHFREVATSIEFEDMGMMAQNAFNSLVQDPLGLGQMESYALLIFGMVVFFIVAKDFYNGFDDPFFGYGTTTKRNDQAESEWKDAEIEMENNLLIRFESIIHGSSKNDAESYGYEQEIKNQSEMLRASKESLNNLLDFKNQIQNDLRTIKDAGNSKLEYYREQYTNIVGNNGRKNHFNIGLNFESSEDASIWDTDDIEKFIADSETRYKNNEKIYTQAINTVNRHIPAYLDKLYATKNDGDKQDGFFKTLLDSKEAEVAHHFKREA